MRKGVWQWYLKQGGKEYGPLSHRELLLIAGLGKLRSGDRIWAPGFPSWVPADLIPGLLKPSLTLSALTFSRSWDATLQRWRASWLREQQRAASWLRGLPIKSALRLPVVWVSVGSIFVLIIIAASTQNSEPSFAIGAPQLSKSKTSDCDPPEQVQTPATPIPTAIPIAAAPAAPMQEEIEALQSVEAVDAIEFPETNEASTGDEVIVLPIRKPAVEPPLRSIDTKNGALSVQRRLRDLGYLADYADGSWGPRSRIALKQFQIRAKIPRTNGWDRRSERALFSGNAVRAAIDVSSPFGQAVF